MPKTGLLCHPKMKEIAMNNINTQAVHPATRNPIAKPVLAIAAVMLLTALTPNQAFAKNCRKVYLQVTNATGGPIKIKDLDYYDTESEKWRSIRVKNEVIGSNAVWQETRTLAHVNNQNVKLKIKYSTKGKHFWKAHKPYVSGSQMCSKRAAYRVTIN
ncbi:hypothetical protein Metme_1732 [Methylomonas methanica MC09]|uniref:Uncharacterized protein n=2 Tax=Methylomonas methanica TaxID=421 RepID=G0A2H0_METMM|nr:hypothetical protein Metme_1732 [Methylomonas methanica MC09]